jgi:hypothetical protein
MGTFRITLFKVVMCVQVFYMLLTSVWSLVNIDSFMFVTGQKTDIWLVKMMAVLLIVISGNMLFYFKTSTNELPVIMQGGFTAAGLTIIDFYYTGRGIINPFYGYDGLFQAAFLGLWIWIFVRWLKDIE